MPKSGRDHAVANGNSKDQAEEALQLMERALELIDTHAGSTDAGAHLDLAIHRLRDWLQAARA